jgi:hypothetical protein
MQQPSRIEQARRRVATTRLIAGTGSVVAFAALALVARAAHPGTHKAASTKAVSTRTASATASTSDDSQDQSDSFFGHGAISSSSSSGTSSAQATSSGS